MGFAGFGEGDDGGGGGGNGGGRACDELSKVGSFGFGFLSEFPRKMDVGAELEFEVFGFACSRNRKPLNN